jgi:hypothetical protein
MVTARIVWSGRQPVLFEIEGHAGQAEYGQDIVCAAVSVLGQTALVSLDEIAGIHDLDYTVEDGYLLVRLPSKLSKTQLDTARILMDSMVLGLRGVAESAPDFVKLFTEEVESDAYQV